MTMLKTFYLLKKEKRKSFVRECLFVFGQTDWTMLLFPQHFCKRDAQLSPFIACPHLFL